MITNCITYMDVSEGMIRRLGYEGVADKVGAARLWDACGNSFRAEILDHLGVKRIADEIGMARLWGEYGTRFRAEILKEFGRAELKNKGIDASGY